MFPANDNFPCTGRGKAGPPQEKPHRNAQRRRRRILLTFAALAVSYVLCNWIGKCRFVTRTYEISDERIYDEVRIALLSDLHASLWGEGQSDLLAAVAEAAPHAVVLDGDLFNICGSDDNTITLLSALSTSYDCYFVFGNHEYQSERADEIRQTVESLGIPVLSGDLAVITVGETRVQLFGVDDAHGGEQNTIAQLDAAARLRDDSLYSILAIHCPNQVERNLSYGFDLILSGHTHGGQVRIPGLLNGLYAPGQGFFPKYGGGRYDFGAQTMIISRGLSKKPYWAPRVFDLPELVVVRLTPAGG